MRFAVDALQKIHGLLAAAAISDVARGRQIVHGNTTYRSIPELWENAVRYTIEEGKPLTLGNIRRNADNLIEQMKSMIQDDVGIAMDEMGRRYPEEYEPYVPVKPLDLEAMNQNDPYRDTPF